MNNVILTFFTLRANNYRFWSLIIQILGCLSIILACLKLWIGNEIAKKKIKRYTIQQAQKFTKYNLKDSEVANQEINNSKIINKYKTQLLVHRFNKIESIAKMIPFDTLSSSTKYRILHRIKIIIFTRVDWRLLNWCRCYETGCIDKKLLANQIGKDYIYMIDRNKDIFKQLNKTHQFELCYNVYVSMKQLI